MGQSLAGVAGDGDPWGRMVLRTSSRSLQDQHHSRCPGCFVHVERKGNGKEKETSALNPLLPPLPPPAEHHKCLQSSLPAGSHAPRWSFPISRHRVLSHLPEQGYFGAPGIPPGRNRRAGALPSSWAVVKAEGSPSSSMTEQLRLGSHMVPTSAIPSVSHVVAPHRSCREQGAPGLGPEVPKAVGSVPASPRPFAAIPSAADGRTNHQGQPDPM